MRNRYLFLLNNNWTGEKFLFELFNLSCDPRYYEFDIQVPDEMEYGEYDYFLLHCELPYELEFSNNLIDSRITVMSKEGERSSWFIRDLSAESGMLSYEPAGGFGPRYDKFDVDSDRINVAVQ